MLHRFCCKIILPCIWYCDIWNMASTALYFITWYSIFHTLSIEFYSLFRCIMKPFSHLKWQEKKVHLLSVLIINFLLAFNEYENSHDICIIEWMKFFITLLTIEKCKKCNIRGKSIDSERLLALIISSRKYRLGRGREPWQKGVGVGGGLIPLYFSVVFSSCLSLCFPSAEYIHPHYPFMFKPEVRERILCGRFAVMNGLNEWTDVTGWII